MSEKILTTEDLKQLMKQASAELIRRAKEKNEYTRREGKNQGKRQP